MNGPRVWFGSALILIGVLLLLGEIDLFDFGYILRTYWPLILIIVGVYMLVVRRGVWVHRSAADKKWAAFSSGNATVSEGDVINSSSVFGDVHVRVTSQKFRGGTVSTVFGSAKVDLSGALVDTGKQHLRVNGTFGDIKIRLRPEIPVSITARTSFGSARIMGESREGISSEIRYESPGFEASERGLVIEANQSFGDITIA